MSKLPKPLLPNRSPAGRTNNNMQTRITVKSLIFNELGQILILQRSANDAHRPNGYDFPGGSVNDGEDLIAGALREIQEETGLIVQMGSLQLVYATCKMARTTSHGKGQPSKANLLWLGYVTSLPQGQTIHLSHEHDRYAWLTINEFLIATGHPAHRTLINYIRDNNIAYELWGGKR